ncbi:hypothetical protein ACFFGH_33665 [Lysobacter korlensis]|uniref:Ig-like domain-containing protein n=1 Tax=Lysobacter korlensis TaxID=553636 RepID=A0ABV6S0P2_9GAMM
MAKPRLLGGFLSLVLVSALVSVPGVANAAAPFDSAPTPAITGEAVVGGSLTADPGAWSPEPTALGYQWLRDGEPIAEATADDYTLTAADLGAQVAVEVTASLEGYDTTTLSSSTVGPVTAGAFTSAPIPLVVGTLLTDRTLTVNAGTWAPAAALSYQWLRNGNPISGAVGTSYQLTSADTAQSIAVAVTGVRAGYTTATRTSASAVVGKASFTTKPVPKITGTAKLAQTLTAVPGTWAPSAAVTYVWKRDGITIPGATARTYKLTTADVNRRMTVTVTAARPGYTSVSLTSAKTATVTGHAFTYSPAPKVSGTRAVGRLLSASTATWSPMPSTVGYQWLRNGVAIPGATGKTYRLQAADLGKYVTVKVTAGRTGYTTTSRTASQGTAVVRGTLSAPTPAISGTPRAGATLTAATGTWSPSGVQITYQWLRNGVKITGATSKTYRLTSADLGKTIKVSVRGTKSGFTTLTKTSKSTVVITITKRIAGDGSYQIGTNLAAGTYATSTATRFCYWERVSGWSGSFDDIIANDLGAGQRIVTVYPSDVGLVTEGCGSWVKLSDLGVAPRSSVAAEAVVAVNAQVRPGLYQANDGSDGCYWARLSGFSGLLDDITDNYYGESARPIVRIFSTDKGFETSNCGGWVRIGS